VKDADIQAGIIYGVAPRWQDKPEPTVVLENKPRSIFVHRGDGIQIAPEQDGQPRVGGGTAAGGQGYAAVTGPADNLQDLDCAAEISRLRDGLGPSRPGLKWTLITQLSKVLGPYQDALRAYQDTQSSLTAAADRRRAEVDAAISELTARGATEVHPGYHDATITMAAADAARLLDPPSRAGDSGREPRSVAAAAGINSHAGRHTGQTESTTRAPDDRGDPGGISDDARLAGWLAGERTDPRIRRDGTEPVTITGGDLFGLLLKVRDWACRNGIADSQMSGQPDTGPDILNLGFPVTGLLEGPRPVTRQRPASSPAASGDQPGVPKGTGFTR
jgi:hypothetical protein